MKLTKYKLGEILELQRGYDLPSSQMKVGNILVAGSNGVIGYHNEARSNHPCITVGRSGSVGKVHYYEQATWAHNTALFVKDFKGNNPQYLYYFLKNLHLDKMFVKGSSVVPSLDRKVVHSLIVPFHRDIACQKSISSILSNIDRKIELNRAINQNLEAMAKQLYDYWFVQFDFPNEEGEPYKLSGGKMVWNEKLKREIPEGWNVMSINEICTSCRGVSYGKDDLLSNGSSVRSL
jgi:putative type I DNA restriction-modification